MKTRARNELGDENRYSELMKDLPLERAAKPREIADMSLCREGADAGRFIAAFSKQPYRRLQYPVARNLRWPTHFRPLTPDFKRVYEITIIFMSGIRQTRKRSGKQIEEF